MSQSRFTGAFEMKPVRGMECSDMLTLLAAGDGVTATATLLAGDDRGDCLVYAGEQVTVAPGQAATEEGYAAEIERPLLHENMFVLRQGGQAKALTLAWEKEWASGFDEAGARRFRRIAQEIGSGVLAGEHVIYAVKRMEPAEETDEFLALNVAASRSNDGPNAVAALEVCLERSYAARTGLLCQRLRIVHDRVTGVAYTGAVLGGTQWVTAPSLHNPAAGVLREISVADPLPQLTADSLQERFQPRLPVNRPLTSPEWMWLLTGPLVAADRLQAM